jgi:predicted KAP-like P-loop ATPase
MQEVSQQLRKLIGQAAAQRRLIIFVDDLERCKPPRAIEVCETASQLLSHPNVVTVLIGDMTVIATSADIKYRDLELRETQRTAMTSYGRRYLEKIVQIQFDLPASALQSIQRIIEAQGEERSDHDSKMTQHEEEGLRDERSYIEKLKWKIPSRMLRIQGLTLGLTLVLLYAYLIASWIDSAIFSYFNYIEFSAVLLCPWFSSL